MDFGDFLTRKIFGTSIIHKIHFFSFTLLHFSFHANIIRFTNILDLENSRLLDTLGTASFHVSQEILVRL